MLLIVMVTLCVFSKNLVFRNCRWNLDYEVSHDRPILWLYSILRCDG